jgi:DNA-binding transcriptional MocR family regulator
MTELINADLNELHQAKEVLRARYQDFTARNLKLDMTRGKPCPEQLDLSLPLLELKDYKCRDGTDCRNYGLVEGIPEARQLFAGYLEVTPEEIIVAGNSSLALMHDSIMRLMVKGAPGYGQPWINLPKVKCLCPSPGYDRHFFICSFFNMEMIPVELTAEGPDMEMVEALAREDDAIKAIWCVPRYSNPTGTTYSAEVVERLARMPAKARDFTIIWDNAYKEHHLTANPEPLADLLSACKATGNPERVLMFGSTSKITFPGAGVAMLAASKANIEAIKRQSNIQSIGPDKINQLRHVKFLRDMEGIKVQMQKHAALLKPKFDVVLNLLERELGTSGLAQWSKPQGGYFVSLDTLPGCAQAVVKLAETAGVKLTPAGNTYPYGKDPLDRNIRIAPSFPALSEITLAMELLAICVKLAAIEKLMEGTLSVPRE